MKKIKRIPPGPGQESVWDYPRPPKIEASSKHIKVIFNEQVIAESNRACRVLETSHPPVYYIPPSDVNFEFLNSNSEVSFCEYKGKANYYDVKVGDRQASDVAWYYPAPTKPFLELKDYLAFYPDRVECYVNDERVNPQEGNFYGGWITNEIVGPFKGGSGTWGW